MLAKLAWERDTPTSSLSSNIEAHIADLTLLTTNIRHYALWERIQGCSDRLCCVYTAKLSHLKTCAPRRVANGWGSLSRTTRGTQLRMSKQRYPTALNAPAVCPSISSNIPPISEMWLQIWTSYQPSGMVTKESMTRILKKVRPFTSMRCFTWAWASLPTGLSKPERAEMAMTGWVMMASLCQSTMVAKREDGKDFQMFLHLSLISTPLYNDFTKSYR